jgi:hypothetical protein
MCGASYRCRLNVSIQPVMSLGSPEDFAQSVAGAIRRALEVGENGVEQMQ